MNRITLWYAGLNRRSRITLLCGAIAVALIAIILVGYMILSPKKIQVTYGTRIVDPVDGYVWEDNTQTIWVNPSEAGNYHVEVKIKYSEEHARQIEEDQARRVEEQQEQATHSGYELYEFAAPTSQMEDLETIQKNIEVVGQTVVSGLEIANEITEIRSALVTTRNEVAAITVIPELEQDKQQILQALDKYIAACDLVLEAIETGNRNLLTQATVQTQEATDILLNLTAKYQDLFQDWENIIPDLEKLIP